MSGKMHNFVRYSEYNFLVLNQPNYYYTIAREKLTIIMLSHRL